MGDSMGGVVLRRIRIYDEMPRTCRGTAGWRHSAVQYGFNDAGGLVRRDILKVFLGVLGVFVIAGVGSAAEVERGADLLQSGTVSQIALQRQQNIGNETGKQVSSQEISGKQVAEMRIDVAVGQEFTVTLASNATTGYHWELSAPLDEAVVRLIGSDYRAADTKLLGAPGKEVWTFQAVGPGQTVITLKYVRPWEKNVAPIETASYRVTVN